MLNPINVIVLADYIVAKSRAIVPRNRTRKFLRDTVQLNNTRQGISSTLRDKRSLDSVHYHPIPNRFARITILSEKIVMVLRLFDFFSFQNFYSNFYSCCVTRLSETRETFIWETFICGNFLVAKKLCTDSNRERKTGLFIRKFARSGERERETRQGVV